MASRWRLANRKRPEGQLDRTKHFLASAAAAGPGRLAARAVSVPIEMDTKAAVLAAGGLAGVNTRSFEIWRDRAAKKTRCVLVADASDMDAYVQAFSGMYPNAAFHALGETRPGWFDKRRPDYEVFDVGTYHGHYASVLDRSRAHRLVTGMANMLELSHNAWIQFVFRRHGFGSFLARHVNRLDARAKEIRAGNYLSTLEQLSLSEKKPHDHPELGHDFANNHAGLLKHATLKMQSDQVVMSIRGLVRSDREIDFGFGQIETLPVENMFSGHEHLTKFRYKYQNFWDAEKPRRVEVRAGGRRLPRIGIFEDRLLPDPDKLLGPALARYFDKDWLGRYRTRDPLPFLMLNLSEIPLFVHLPDPSVTSVETTRGVHLPSQPSEKDGFGIGSLGAPPGAGERRAGDGAGAGECGIA
ncbi:MAG: hypothetical protein OXK17_01440 [Thaumarchaeota archaeon]|nr:hypothetical protein [Nitrososphaerota archaeon]